ncbi:MAG: hypothetical protein FJ392_05275, partial [Verrucomicrobia bacterium]|nr:hypothetical protein [Verrucomicrobiota bacterium]
MFSTAALVLSASVAFAAPALQLTLRKCVETKPASGEFKVTTAAATWNPKQTAIIVCDMWDLHHCKNAVLREGEFAPRLNDLLEKAREQGV